jgi:hypothetical protein
VAHQDEGALGVQVQRSLQGREEGKEDVPETVDGPGSVGDEVPPTGEQELQLGEIVFAGNEPSEVGPHPGLLGDDVGVASIGLGLPGVGLARTLHGQAREVEDLLVSLPQKRQKQRRAAPGWSTAQRCSSERASTSSMSPERSASSFSTLRERIFVPEASST